MAHDFEYMPVFRSRQQEIKVLKSFDFGDQICPLIEVIKEKDRKNKKDSPKEIYSEIINSIKAPKVLLDLPVYLKEASNTQEEVVKFIRGVIQDKEKRVDFLNQFNDLNEKVIPVISSLLLATGEPNTIQYQSENLEDNFPELAYRIFHNTFDEDLEELEHLFDPETDILIYDLDKVEITSPVVRKQVNKLKNAIGDGFKVMVRSAINEEVQNVKLDHEEIVGEANNSLVEMYKKQGFDAFGDYAGIKKDDLTSGGTISPGFIFYDPYDNLFYGFKSDVKELEEFERTIVPAVLNSPVVQNLQEKHPEFIEGNPGIEMLRKIRDDDKESGKNQAKFKKISMDHYLHCIKTSIEKDEPLPINQ